VKRKKLLRIRLRRNGKKKHPYYRVVVADQRAPRDGDFIEVIGHYNPRTQPSTVVLNEERVKHWIEIGAQPSETVHRVLHKAGLITSPPPTRITKPTRAEQEALKASQEPSSDDTEEQIAEPIGGGDVEDTPSDIDSQETEEESEESTE